MWSVWPSAGAVRVDRVASRLKRRELPHALTSGGRGGVRGGVAMTALELILVAVISALLGAAHGQATASGSGMGVHTSTVAAEPGGSVTIMCGIHPGGNVFWYKKEEGVKMELARDSLLIVSDRRYQLQSDNGYYKLTIKPTVESDSGMYICESSDRDGGVYLRNFQMTIAVGAGAARVSATVVGTIAAALMLLV